MASMLTQIGVSEILSWWTSEAFEWALWESFPFTGNVYTTVSDLPAGELVGGGYARVTATGKGFSQLAGGLEFTVAPVDFGVLAYGEPGVLVLIRNLGGADAANYVVGLWDVAYTADGQRPARWVITPASGVAYFPGCYWDATPEATLWPLGATTLAQQWTTLTFQWSLSTAKGWKPASEVYLGDLGASWECAAPGYGRITVTTPVVDITPENTLKFSCDAPVFGPMSGDSEVWWLILNHWAGSDATARLVAAWPIYHLCDGVTPLAFIFDHRGVVVMSAQCPFNATVTGY